MRRGRRLVVNGYGSEIPASRVKPKMVTSSTYTTRHWASADGDERSQDAGSRVEVLVHPEQLDDANRIELLIGLSGSKTPAARQRPEIRLHPGDGSPPSARLLDALFEAFHKPAVALAGPGVAPELAHQQSFSPSSLPYVLRTDSGRRDSAPVPGVSPVQIRPSTS